MNRRAFKNEVDVSPSKFYGVDSRVYGSPVNAALAFPTFATVVGHVAVNR